LVAREEHTMDVTVTVKLDDGTEVKRTVGVDSSDNPLFWSNGIQQGVSACAESIRRMVESEYGTSDYEGIHVLRAAPVGG
jgi:hypothetical protein